MGNRKSYSKIKKGDQFDYLLVIERDDTKKVKGTFKNKLAYFKCKCKCGKNVIKTSRYLLDKRNTCAKKSCGCSASEYLIVKNKKLAKHNLSKDPRYVIHAQMKQRCYNKSHAHYNRYGGRNIKVCQRWLGKDGFINFVNDMGDRKQDKYPSGRSKYTIDRIDNDGDYEPSNCRWATYKQQWENKR